MPSFVLLNQNTTDLPTSQVEMNQVSDEQPSCPQNIVTP